MSGIERLEELADFIDERFEVQHAAHGWALRTNSPLLHEYIRDALFDIAAQIKREQVSENGEEE